MANISVGPQKLNSDPRYVMAQALMQNGQSMQANNGIDGLNKALSQILAAKQMKKVQDEYSNRENLANDQFKQAMVTALGQKGGYDAKSGITWDDTKPDMSMAIQNLSGNPDTAPLAQELMMKQLDQQREEQKYQRDIKRGDLEFDREAKLKRELANIRAGAATVDPDTGEIVQPAEQKLDYGVPATSLDTRGLSPKDASMFAKQTRLDAQKRLQDSDMVQSADKARNNLADSKRFMELMDQQDTGGFLLNTPLVGSLMTTFDPELNEMKKIQDRLTPQQRTPGSGATSDFDAKMFQNSLFGVDAPKQSNQAVVAAMQAKSQMELDRQSFLTDYLNANGHLNGADKAWQNYVDNNPIFDPASPNTPKLNKSRKSYHDYFGGGQEQLTNPSAPTPEQALEILRKRGKIK